MFEAEDDASHPRGGLPVVVDDPRAPPGPILERAAVPRVYSVQDLSEGQRRARTVLPFLENTMVC